MVNASNGVRLVKCPKCLNLLPELPNVPVYKCGGCGTILRAKIRVTSGETASSESTQRLSSMEISEKGLISSDSKNSLLNENYSEKNGENSNHNSSELEEKIRDKNNTSSASESPNPKNSDSKDSSELVTPVVTAQEEIIEKNNIKSSKENQASETLNRVNSDLNGKSEKRKVHVRKNASSSVSEEFHSAPNFKVSENAPKKVVIYRKPPRKSHNFESTKTNSYDVLQADILSRVDKLRHELVELFGKPLEEIDNYFQAESSRYRRVRIDSHQNISKPNNHHNLNFHKIEKHQNNRRPQIVPKNLCRPILIGSPFVICSECFKLLQLPADFNVETKRLRKLQCGNCEKVLLYSYRPQPFGTAPLSFTGTETRTGTETGTTPFMDLEFRNRLDPISISEEYGLSFNNISYSTEPDQSEKLYVSRNSSFSTNDGLNCKKVVGSRLHQIMGYESASDILMRRVSDVSSVRNHEDYERERKGKGILVNEYSESEKSMMKGIYGRDSPRRSRIHGLFKKGVSILMA
ncbi:hypothetical protein LUZ60_013146 [Juncus effusus]|nr:hypothetical protein LUZ60_013146 [Juncus effusus]